MFASALTFNLQEDTPNPLKAFVMPEDVGDVKTTSEFLNPMARPNYKVGARMNTHNCRDGVSKGS
jgi:hypothetical protein